MLKRFLLAASFLIFCTPSLVSACSCAVGGGKCDQSWNFGKVIFAGTVTRELSPTEVFSRKVFQLSVSESFRGPAIPGQEVKIYTGAGGGDCGYPFEIGTSYLVYAHPVGDRLVTSICSHTGTAAHRAHILQQLRALQRGEPGAALFGMIMKLPAHFTGEPLEVTPLEGRRVRVIGSDKFELSTTTDEQGVFSFPTLPPNKYQIEVKPPPAGMSSWHFNRGMPYTVEIGATEVSGCSATPFFRAEGMIKGTVTDEYGHSLAGSVTLEPADANEASRRRDGLTTSTDTGAFQILVPVVGKYRLIYRPKAGAAPPVMSDVIDVQLGRIEVFQFKVPSIRP